MGGLDAAATGAVKVSVILQAAGLAPNVAMQLFTIAVHAGVEIPEQSLKVVPSSLQVSATVVGVPVRSYDPVLVFEKRN